MPTVDAASEQASWNPAFRPNSDQEEDMSTPLRTTEAAVAGGHAEAPSQAVSSSESQTSPEASKSQSRHFAQSASIHHLPEPDETESTPDQEGAAFDDLPKQGIDYTNSFPPVSAQRDADGHAQDSIPEPLPQSQLEDIITEPGTHEHSVGLATRQEILQAADEVNHGWGGDEDDFFAGPAGGHDQTTTVEDDSRFGEGLPLVSHHGNPEESTQAELDWGETGADDDFFGGAAQSQDALEPGALERKSTSQVLDSMRYPPYAETHADSLKSTEEPSTGELTDNGLAVPAEPAAAAVVEAEKSAEPSTQQSADLSDLWSEALDDDLLLEDDSAALDPSTFFEDDGEGFLDDSELVSNSAPAPAVDHSAQLNGSSATTGPSRYAPAHNTASHLPNGLQTALPSTANPNVALGAQARPEPAKAQSFVDKSKGGYASPFDLPMDLQPKRQAAPRQPSVRAQNQGPAPPPQASRISSPPGQFTTLQATLPGRPPAVSTQTAPQPAGSGPGAKSTFFEELPIAPRLPRPSSTTRFTPAPAPQVSGSPQASAGLPPRPVPPNNPPTNFDHGLVLPQRQLPFNHDSTPQPQAPQVPPKTSNRYSPSPSSQPSQTGVSPAQGRYSSASATSPPPATLQRAPSVGFIPPFQPRTSSPLARSTSISDEPSSQQEGSASSAINGIQRGLVSPEMSPPLQRMMHSPEKVKSATGSSFGSPAQASAASTGPNLTQQSGTVRRRRAPSLIKQYIPPSDDRAQDPLERWKGGPIFKFGASGVVTCFPTETPRFSIGQSQPLYMVAPGEVKVRAAKQVMNVEDFVASFPGPLKNKSKKKEVLAWLNKRVETMKAMTLDFSDYKSPELAHNRHDERLLLFRVLTVLVENDGKIDAAPAAKAIRDVLVPPATSADPQFGGASYGSEVVQGITKSCRLQPKVHTTDVNDVEEIRKLLLQGEREKAAWLAVDKNLWGHAMLVASTMQGETWKQVIHEFVRNEVRTCGNHTEGLAALYDVFSGNWDESIDQLVPASARSGFQMVNKTGPSSEQNVLAGLDRWRETLALIISNRTNGDSKALISLGEMLAGYGRAEASHLCYIIAKLPGLFSGADDPAAHAVLLGADHRQRPFDIHNDIEAILATEVYDFAVNTIPGGTPTVPMLHLAPYKLQHAQILAETGHRDEAQQYCEAITASLKAHKTAPYLHGQLVSSIDDLVNRLSQAPREASKSWLANPKMGNVSSSLLSSFNKFVAGDDSDNASTASGPTTEPGPFGSIAGEPVSISRAGSPSVSNAGYGAQVGYNSGVPVPIGNSRYAPGGSYSSSPSGSYTTMQHRDSSGSLPRMSPDHTRRAPAAHYQPSGSYTPSSGLAYAQSYSSDIPRSVPATSAPSHSGLDSFPFDSRPSTSDGPEGAQRRSSYEPSLALRPQRDRNSSGYQPRSTGPDSRGSSSYAPRSGSYAPRSYAPSPAGAERKEAQASSEPSSGYTPSIPQEAETQPQRAQESTTEVNDSKEPEAPISFGYDPTPSYGYPSPNPPMPEETLPEEPGQPSYGYQPVEPNVPDASATETTAATAGGYEPPSSSYEPPSYQPYHPETNGDEPESPVKQKKRGGIMDLDDEDDVAATAERLKKEEKVRKDREAEEAFKRAAEADAARDNKGSEGQKKGWFGGWLGGAKKEQEKGPEPAVHKAKLGEESSFVYDENLKKWVNKKAGAEAATAKTAAPPPPKGGPPSRAASAMGPPRTSIPTSLPASSSLPPSRNVSPLISKGAANVDSASEAGTPPMGPVSDASGHPPSGGPPMGGGLAPPSRPGTGMSGASTTSTAADDLLGGLGPRKGAAGKRGKKSGRYVDVMAK